MGANVSSAHSDSAVTQGGTPAPLIALPAELRLKIYRCYFEDIENTEEASLSTLQVFLPILQSNSLVRSEAAPMFYKAYIARQNLRNRLVFSSFPCDDAVLIRRIGALCSLLSIYNSDLEFTIALENSSGEPLSRPLVETFLDLMALRVRVSKRILSEYKKMWFGSSPGSRWQHFGFDGMIGGFTFKYSLGSEDDGLWAEESAAETFEVTGQLAKLNWSKADLESLYVFDDACC